MFLEINPCFQRAHVFCMDLQPAADPYNVVCNFQQAMQLYRRVRKKKRKENTRGIGTVVTPSTGMSFLSDIMLHQDTGGPMLLVATWVYKISVDSNFTFSSYA